jgi:hypothetical protein
VTPLPRIRSVGALVATAALACTAAPAIERDPREEEVLAATLRQQITEHLDATARSTGTVVCLGIDPGGAPQSPHRDFMARFAREKAARRLAECDARPEGAVEAMTLRPAVIVTAGPIEWRAADEAWVTVRFFRSSHDTAVRTYRVVREREGWVSLGPILVGGPEGRR